MKAKMKRITVCVICTIVISAILLGMWSAEVLAAAKLPKAFVYITNPEGTSFYRAAVAQTHMVGKYTGIQILVQPSAGTRVSTPMIQRGDGQIGMTTSASGREEYKGIGEDWKGKPNPCMRVFMLGHPVIYGFITRRDSGIRTLADLRGKRVVSKLIGMKGSDMAAAAELKAYGLVPGKDFTELKGSNSKEAMEMVKEKRAHAYAAMVREPNTAVLDQTAGAFIIPVDRAKIPAILAELPGYSAQTLPAGKPGTQQATLAVGCFSVLWGREDLPEDVVYNIVKTLIVHQKELVPIHEDFEYWTMEKTAEFAAQVEIPFHPGAVKYLKERNVWTKDMQRHSDQLLKYHDKN